MSNTTQSSDNPSLQTALLVWDVTKFYVEKYYHYGFGAWIGLICIVLFLSILFCHQKPKLHQIPPKQTFHQTLLSWRQALDRIQGHYSTNHRLNRVKFYLSRLIGLSLLIWLLIWFYQINFYMQYLYYIQRIYLAVFLVEYFIYLNVLRISIPPNFNNVNHDKTALLIPLGGSDMEDKINMLDRVLPAAIRVIKPTSIYVLHNGRSASPDFYREMRAMTDKHGVNYIYLPVGSKSFAVFYCAAYLCNDETQCLITDDDVILPDNFFIPEISDDYDALGYPINTTINPTDSGWSRLLSDFQNLEYGMSGLVKIAQANWSYGSSMLSHHGAIGLWKRDKLAEVMLKHDSVFHGEDLMMGIICYSLGYRMGIVDNVFVSTEPPKKVFGFGGLYRQRVWSWDYILLKYIPIYIKLLINTSILENLAMKIFIVYELWTTFIDLQRFPVVIYALYINPVIVGSFLAGVTVLNIGLMIWFNYVVMINQNRHSSLISIILFSFYKFLLTVLRLFGELRYLFKYVSDQHRCPVRIKDMPELPNIRDQINISFDEVDWTRIWKDQAYMRQTMKLDKLINQVRATTNSSSGPTNYGDASSLVNSSSISNRGRNGRRPASIYSNEKLLERVRIGHQLMDDSAESSRPRQDSSSSLDESMYGTVIDISQQEQRELDDLSDSPVMISYGTAFNSHESLESAKISPTHQPDPGPSPRERRASLSGPPTITKLPTVRFDSFFSRRNQTTTDSDDSPV